ncbi:MAG: choice-of-anchor J domain-containing protein [Bacteroidales bacterium]|nr:choice-of-anchor J domain-containing protein [Bacteroidales bacterium]
MSKKLIIGTLALLLALCVNVNAQVAVVMEGFEQGLPSTWSQDTTAGMTPWTVSSSGLNGVSAYNGSNYLSLFTTTQQVAVKVCMPLTDISSINNPEISFYLVQQARGVNIGYARDTLRLYARTSTTATWTLVQTFSTEQSTWTRQHVDLSSYVSNNAQIAFEFVYGSGLGIGIDDIRLGDATACYTPNGLAAYRITSSSAELMWSAYDLAYEYGLKVSTTALADPATATANVLDTLVYYKPYTVTGLQPATDYYFYVNSNCGDGDVSGWSAAGTFKTACAAESLPYMTGMEASTDFNTCWTRVFEANGDWGTTTPTASAYGPQTSATAKHTGSYSARLYAYYSNSTSYSSPRTIKSYIASQEMAVNSINDCQVTFWAYGSTATAQLHVGVMSDPNDFSTFEELATVQTYTASTWEEYTVPFDAASNSNAKYVCFMADGLDGTSSSYVYVDDVTVDSIPPCPKPAMVKATNVVNDHATISWMGTAPSWEVKVNSSAMTDPSDTADIYNGSTTAKSIVLTGLTARSSYYVYVRANCSSTGNGYGAWSNPVMFTTTPIVATPPYFTGFEDPTDNQQWDIYNGTAANQWFIGSAVNNGGSNALYITNDAGVTNAYTFTQASAVFAVRTIMLPPGTHNISFDWQCYGESSNDYLRAELRTQPTTYNAGTAVTNNGTATAASTGAILLNKYTLNRVSSWQHFSGDVTVADTTVYELAFYWRCTSSGGALPAPAIDNLSITSYSCTSPQQLFANVTNLQNISFNWNSGGESKWQFQLLDNAGNVLVDTLLTTTNISFGNLLASSYYKARVRGECSASDHGWWVENEFHTPCGDITSLPYRENFQNYGTGSGSLSSCWHVSKQYSSYPYVSASAYNHTPNTGTTGALYFYAYLTTNNMVAMPRFNVPGKSIRDLQISFYGLTTSANNSITVGVMSDPDDYTTFVPVTTVSQSVASTLVSQNWELFEIDFSNYTGNGEYIAFYDGTRKATNTFFIDDIVVEAQASCVRPKQVSTTDMRDTQASFTFTSAPNAVAFQGVALQANADFAVENIVASAISNTDTVTITGLNPNTSYDFYVRAICGVGDTSTWSMVYNFTTTYTLSTLPYYTTFADSTDNTRWVLENGGATNRWYIGNAAGNNDSTALYITNDLGETNAYTGGNASYTYAYRTFHFTPGVYTFNFDWRCAGYTTYNLMRAYLVPSTVRPVAGNAYGMTTTTNTDPEGWISLSGSNADGKLNLQPTWQNLQYDFTVTEESTYHLVFFWKNSTASGSQPAAAVDNVNISRNNCASAFSTDVSDTYNVYTFSPLVGTPATYEVIADENAIDFNNLSAVAHHLVTTNTTDTLKGLTENTSYHAYVRTICANGDTGNWLLADFQTECSLIRQLPVTWNFDDAPTTGSGSVYPCWTRVSGGSNPYVYNYGSTALTPNNVLYFYQSSSATAAPNIMAMPKLGVDSVQQVRVEFYTYYTTTDHRVMVGVMDDLSDLNSFVPVDTVSVQTASKWEKQTVRFRNYSGSGKYIAFKTDYGLRSSYNYIRIDNVTLREDRLCEEIDGLNVTNLNSTGAQLNWNTSNGLTYTVLLTTAEVNPDTITGNEPEVVTIETGLTDNHLDLSGLLTTNVTYWFYVQADCQTSDHLPSVWSEGYEFTTVCPSYSLPYSESFSVANPGPGTIPSCWQAVMERTGSESETSTYIVEPYIYTGGNIYQTSDTTDSCSLRLACYYSATASTKTFAILPEFSGSFSGYKLNFRTACTASLNNEMRGILLVGYLTDVSDMSTFVTIDTINTDNHWNLYSVSLENITNATGLHLALKFDGDLNQRSGYFYIDELSIDTSVPCSAPSNIRTNIDGGNVDITVNTVNPADTLVQIAIQKNNVVVRDTIIRVSALPWHVEDLDGLTTYDIVARVVCNLADSTYSAPYYRAVSFTTGCSPVKLPYSYGFDDAGGSGAAYKPTCWTTFQSNAGTTYPYIYGSYSSSAPACLYFCGSTTYTSYGVTPELKIDLIQKAVLSFKGRKTSASYKIVVGVMTDPTDQTTFVPVDTITNAATSTWEDFTVRFDKYTGNGKYIAFACGFGASSYYSIDDVYIERETNCKRPSAPTFVGHSENSLTASWTAGESLETTWDVVVMPEGSSPDETTTPAATVTSTQATVAGLNPNTPYVFYVRAVCDSVEHSNWIGSAMRTACTAVTINDSLSFADSFDSYGTGSSVHPTCWITGTNYTSTAYPYVSTTHNSGVGSLYFYGSSSTYSYAATPELIGTPISQMKLSFMGRMTSAAYYIEVGVMTNPIDESTFVPVKQITCEATNTWEPFDVRFVSYTGNGRYIAFRIPQATTSYFFVDDVVIEKMVACSAPDVDIVEVNRDTLALNVLPIYSVDSAWQIVITPQSSSATPDFSSAVVNDTLTTSSSTFSGYNYNTRYTLYIRTLCNSSNIDWNAITFTTPCGPVTVDFTHTYVENFDNKAAGSASHPDCWTTHSTSATAYPYIYSTYKYSGANSLYFYASTSGGCYGVLPEIVGLPINQMRVNFKGYCGSTSYRLRVGVMTDPDDVTTFEELDVITASATSTWLDYTVLLSNYTGTGRYIAFATPQNASSTWYIDDVEVMASPVCSEPGLIVDINDYNDIDLTINPSNASDTTFVYAVTSLTAATVPTISAAVVVDTVAAGVTNITSLQPGTSYSIFARSICGTTWSRSNLQTPCLPFVVNDSTAYVEDFDSYGTGSTAHPTCWTTGTNNTTAYPYVNSTHNSGVGSLYFCATANYYSYAATPELTGTPVNRMRVSFSLRKASAAAYFLEVGAMTDPNDYSTFQTITSVAPTATSTWEDFYVDLNAYTGNGQYVAFRTPQGATDYIYLDDVTITPIPSCAAPTVTSTVDNDSISLTIIPAQTDDSEWEIVVNQSENPNDTIGALYHSVVTSTSTIGVANANYASTYHVHARTHCDTVWSEWSETLVTTPCGWISLPYTETFDRVPSTCWEIRSGLIDNVLAGTDTTVSVTTSIWSVANTGYGLAGSHAKINNYGTGRKHWLISPQFIIDTLTVMSFDLALTDYGNGNVIDNFNNQPDDRFVVLASRDGGHTWNSADVLAEWNNTGTGLSYDSIPNNGENISFSLTRFQGDTIRLAFYAESTVSNGDNDLHIDNLQLTSIHNIVDLTAQTCDGDNYNGNGFSIPSSQIDITAAENVFTRVSADTLYRLTLTVIPSAVTVINDTINAGETYTLNGFNVSTAGTYQRYLFTSLGCDSIVTLNLFVDSTVVVPDTLIDNVAVCDNELPYAWHGNNYTAAGTYNVTENGDLYVLNLIVNPTYNTTETQTITSADLPYTWNGQTITAAGTYTYRGTTAAGCDSVVTLILTVNVGIDYAEDGMFAISPNPVKRGGEVRLDVTLNEADRDGLVIELFTSNGELIDRTEPKEQPMFVKMPDVDGLYMIRLTTGTGRVMYGKVIVK